MARPPSHLQARRKQAQVLREFNLNKKRGKEEVERVRGSEVFKARSEAARAREVVKWYQKALKNVRKQIKRARISQTLLKDEKKRLKVIAAEVRRGTEHAVGTLAEPTSLTKAEAEGLTSKVRALEGELQELRGHFRTSEDHCQRLTERLQKCEGRAGKLARKQNATRGRLRRERGAKAREVDVAKRRVVHLKEKGVLTDRTRTLCRKLAGCGVPADKVNDAIHAVCTAFHINVADNISPRTVLRVVVEGGIAAHLQIVDEMIRAGGECHIPCLYMNGHSRSVLAAFTISGDGTTHKSLTYESRSIAMAVPTYGSGDSGTVYKNRFFGIDHAINHTSAEQLLGWKRKFDEAHSLWLRSPMGSRSPITILESVTRMRGMLTDHAADQKKLARNLEEWRRECDLELRGEQALLLMPLAESVAIIREENDRKFATAGGITAWNSLPDDAKDEVNAAVYKKACIRLGVAEFEKLTLQEKQDAELFIWAGCCMHKELNSVKGGNTRMKQIWDVEDRQGPMKLLNKDNVAFAERGSEEREEAESKADGGGVKTTSLAGAIFRNQDDKKGYQDAFRSYFFENLGYSVTFPDTSSVRYQSHCDAAAELLAHRALYISFLDDSRDKKQKRTFTNMESNVFHAIQDPSTLTELAVLALYGQAISVPYARQVRGEDTMQKNILDQGPLHEQIKSHCRAIIDNPDLLISPQTPHTMATLDKEPWERPEVVAAIQDFPGNFPHLREAIVAFFEGAVEVWERFTTEFKSGGLIAKASAEQRRRAWMRTTNDDNEGALGALRVHMRLAPSMTLDQHNSRMMYAINNTEAWAEERLTPEDAQFIRAVVREREGQGRGKAHFRAQAEADQRTIEEKRRKDQEKEQAKRAETALLDAVNPLLDAQAVRENPGTIAELDLQLAWFRRIDPLVPPKSHLKIKKHKVDALVDAIERFHAQKSVDELNERHLDEMEVD